MCVSNLMRPQDGVVHEEKAEKKKAGGHGEAREKEKEKEKERQIHVRG